MKNPIKINPTSFIFGAVFGGVAIFTIAADSHHSTVFEYSVVTQQIPAYDYTKTVNEAATNGWELVSSQITLKSPENPYGSDGTVFMVLKHPKQ